MKKETILSFSFRQCLSNQQHHFCCLMFWAPRYVLGRSIGLSLNPINKGKCRKNVFVSYLFFYLFFLYISFGTFFGQGIAPASQREVKQCNQNMESDILRQHSLALSPWLSKPSKSHKLDTILENTYPLYIAICFLYFGQHSSSYLMWFNNLHFQY